MSVASLDGSQTIGLHTRVTTTEKSTTVPQKALTPPFLRPLVPLSVSQVSPISRDL